MEETRPAATLESKLVAAKNRFANAEANFKRTVVAKEKKAEDDIAQKTQEIQAILDIEIKNQKENFIKEIEEAFNPFFNDLTGQLNFYGAQTMLDQNKHAKFLELIELIKNSDAYVTQTCNGEVSSNLLNNKWAKIKKTAATLSEHFNHEEKFYGRGFKANIEFTDADHVSTSQKA